MKRALRWLVDFLERKFPDKVTVTESRYKALEAAQAEQAAKIEKYDERLKAVEANVLNLNQAIGFTAPKLGMLER